MKSHRAHFKVDARHQNIFANIFTKKAQCVRVEWAASIYIYMASVFRNRVDEIYFDGANVSNMVADSFKMAAIFLSPEGTPVGESQWLVHSYNQYRMYIIYDFVVYIKYMPRHFAAVNIWECENDTNDVKPYWQYVSIKEYVFAEVNSGGF